MKKRAAWIAPPQEKLRQVAQLMLDKLNDGSLNPGDAKARGQRVCVGGWERLGGRRPAQARWFSVTLDKRTAPWAFRKGERFETIGALELFTSLLFVVAFSSGWPRGPPGGSA